MSRTYYTLLLRDDSASPWRIEYGTYDRVDVAQELWDRMDAEDILYTNTKIIESSGKQADIDEIVTTLNERFSK